MNQPVDLRAAHLIDADVEGQYVLYSFADQISTQPHHHDFFEVFLIASGSIYHHVNDTPQLLEAGALVFIRPDDYHYYQPNGEHNCELVNLAYLRGTFQALAGYLGMAREGARLLNSTLPPTHHLSADETDTLRARLEAWGHLAYTERGRARPALRALLADLVVRYFPAGDEADHSNTPAWLVEVCREMSRNRDYVTEGRDALLRLATRSPAYVGRTFKLYLGKTPSQYVNDLRLDYAGELLLHTDQPVTDICYQIGFDNLSYFYRLFRERWGCPPNQYRDANRRTPIP